MLELVIPERELFNETTGEFLNFKETKLQLEHSLISLSKWEAETNKPFLSSPEKTRQSMDFYIKCMDLNRNTDPIIFETLPSEAYHKIMEYINLPMTATTINDMDNRLNNDIITSEIIYYWMVKLGIPFECQKWHLNRLIMLIRVCSVKEGPQKKMTKREVYAQNRELNEARRRQMNSKG